MNGDGLSRRNRKSTAKISFKISVNIVLALFPTVSWFILILRQHFLLFFYFFYFQNLCSAVRNPKFKKVWLYKANIAGWVY